MHELTPMGPRKVERLRINSKISGGNQHLQHRSRSPRYHAQCCGLSDEAKEGKSSALSAFLNDIDVVRVDEVWHGPTIQVVLPHALLGQALTGLRRAIRQRRE